MFLFFGFSHSIWASDPFKRSLFTRFPKLKFSYRFLYSVVSTLFLGFWYLTLPKVQITFYSLTGWIFYFFITIQLVAAFGLVHAVFISYPRVFIGWFQLFDRSGIPYFLDEPENPNPLRVNSVYQWVRHPMYFWSIVYLIANPNMTDRHLFMTILFSFYFYLGSIPEEKKLELRYGNAYLNYKKSVPRLIPNPFKFFKS